MTDRRFQISRPSSRRLHRKGLRRRSRRVPEEARRPSQRAARERVPRGRNRRRRGLAKRRNRRLAVEARHPSQRAGRERALRGRNRRPRELARHRSRRLAEEARRPSRKVAQEPTLRPLGAKVVDRHPRQVGAKAPGRRRGIKRKASKAPLPGALKDSRARRRPVVLNRVAGRSSVVSRRLAERKVGELNKKERKGALNKQVAHRARKARRQPKARKPTVVRRAPERLLRRGRRHRVHPRNPSTLRRWRGLRRIGRTGRIGIARPNCPMPLQS